MCISQICKYWQWCTSGKTLTSTSDELSLRIQVHVHHAKHWSACPNDCMTIGMWLCFLLSKFLLSTQVQTRGLKLFTLRNVFFFKSLFSQPNMEKRSKHREKNVCFVSIKTLTKAILRSRYSKLEWKNGSCCFHSTIVNEIPFDSDNSHIYRQGNLLKFDPHYIFNICTHYAIIFKQNSCREL